MKYRYLLLVASLCLAAVPPAPAAEAPPSGIRKVVLEAQCDNPMELTVLPDGRVLFIERFDLARIWKPDTQKTVVAARFSVHGTLNPSTKKEQDRGSWEAGLIGVTASPDFARTGWIYVYYSPAGNTPENRLSRFTLRGDELDLSSEKVMLQVPIQRDVCCHEAGSLAFDAHGNLFLSTGDNTNPFESNGYNPIDFIDGRYPFDAARSSGNANDLRGKILRIHPEANGRYTIPPGNLFPVSTPRTRPEIFVMGWGPSGGLAGGSKRRFQSRRFHTVMPNSCATTAPVFPLAAQCSTTDRRKTSSYRFGSAGFFFPSRLLPALPKWWRRGSCPWPHLPTSSHAGGSWRSAGRSPGFQTDASRLRWSWRRVACLWRR